ncbi:MAG: hypothetical protein GKS00_01955 [Alphaproteobacteria bacterium]|nr:hypothetical protein [Alphaproteobacteria bacterium]
MAGRSVSSAGDVNGDGFDDLIVGAPYDNGGGTDAGEAYVIFGEAGAFGTLHEGRMMFNLSHMNAREGFVIRGDAAHDLAGYSVSSAGDVNGDGFDDLIVGAPYGDDGGDKAGEAYVIFGGTGAFGTLHEGRMMFNLKYMSPREGFVIRGDAAGDYAGWSVSSAGDVNGDGFDDLIVGAPWGNDGGTDAGEAYVIFGGTGAFGTLHEGRMMFNLSHMNAREGFVIRGDAAHDLAGWSVSSAGDVNGDGYDDLIVGAPYGDDGGTSAGEAYVVFGGPSLGGGYPVEIKGTAGNTTREVLRGGAGDDVLGVSDAGFARIDGGHGMDTLRLDGRGMTLDFTGILPSVVQSIERIDMRGAGANTLRLTLADLLDLSDDTAGGVTTLTVLGDFGDTVKTGDTGWAYAGLTTVDGAEFAEYRKGNGRLLVDADMTRRDLSNVSPDEGFVIRGAALGDRAGWSVSSAGDVNGDGFDDMIVGAAVANAGADTDTGAAYVVFGTAAGFGSADETGRRVLDLDGLSADTGFVILGDAAYDRAGWSVSSAGDVNGDGYDDLIVGAPLGDDRDPGNLNADSGEAYVVFGTTSGFGAPEDPENPAGRRVIDLGELSAETGFIIRGDRVGGQAGWSVSSAGDVNGDGFDDLIVGAPNDGSGTAYVVFGTAVGFGSAADGRQVLDLSELSASEGFIIQGGRAYDNAGWSVSSAGDVNGDGYDDLIIGAPRDDNQVVDAGAAYVVFGTASGFGIPEDPEAPTGRQILDLDGLLSATQGFVIQGGWAYDNTGWSVSSAGDVNGDGFDDLIVGARHADDGGEDAGAAYVIFGKAVGFGTAVGGRQVIDLGNLSADQGFTIHGGALDDQAGWSVSSAGDVNGDGFDDLIVGAPRSDSGGEDAGAAYVVFGKASGFQALDLNELYRLPLEKSTPLPDGFIIWGDAAGDRAGRSVSAAGDVNGDGYDDLMVGAPNGDDGGPNAGAAYVMFGGAFWGSTDPITMTGTAGNETREMLRGGAGDDTLTGLGGADVFRAGAGDDVLGVSDTAFVRIDGGTGRDTLRLDGSGMVLDFTSIPPSIVESIERIDLTGTGGNTLRLTLRDLLDLSDDTSGGVTTLTVLGNAGDVVRLADFGWRAVGGTTIDGESFTRYENGNARLLVDADVKTYAPTIDLGNLSADQGFTIHGGALDDRAGWSVSSAGDVNGDGVDDLIVGAPRTAKGDLTDAGAAYVVFGKASGSGAIDLGNLTADDGFIIRGDAAHDQAGWSVSSAGDVNGDGLDDLIVGAPRGDKGDFTDAGAAYVVFGKASGSGAIDLGNLTADDGFIIRGDAAHDRAGWSVSSAGDVNGDGLDDLIVGAPRTAKGDLTDAGAAYVVFGKASGSGAIDLGNLTADDGFIIRGDAAHDRTGWSVSSAGDVNGDGFDDLIVGAPYGADGAGEAYVVFGTASGFGTEVTTGTGADAVSRRVIDLTTLPAADGFIIQGDAGADRAGWSVSSAGDVNGDGFDDLIVGAPKGDDGGPDAGEAYVVFGKASGFGTDIGGRQVIDLTTLPVADGFIIQGDAAADRAGWSVSSAGDVNGDGFDDLIVGAPFGSDGDDADTGKAYVVFGQAENFGRRADGRQVLDLDGLSPGEGITLHGAAPSDRAGWSVSSAGDVNGDGFDDLIVGAPRGDDGIDAGEAYVVFGGAFNASGSPVEMEGRSRRSDMLLGGAGDDTLVGHGGRDILRAGAGDDVLGISDTNFARIDGGTGEDTLRLDGSGITLDFTAILPSKVDSIGRIDLTGTGDNSLTLDIRDLLDLSDDTEGGVTILRVFGDAGDRVTTADSGWTRAADEVEIDGQFFAQFDNGNARLLIDSDVTVDGIQA